MCEAYKFSIYMTDLSPFPGRRLHSSTLLLVEICIFSLSVMWLKWTALCHCRFTFVSIY